MLRRLSAFFDTLPPLLLLNLNERVKCAARCALGEQKAINEAAEMDVLMHGPQIRRQNDASQRREAEREMRAQDETRTYSEMPVEDDGAGSFSRRRLRP